MTLYDIMSYFTEKYPFLSENFTGILTANSLVVLLFIENSKHIKYNPISAIGKAFGLWISKGIMEKVDDTTQSMEERIEKHIATVEESMLEGIKKAEQGSQKRGENLHKEISQVKNTMSEELSQYNENGVARANMLKGEIEKVREDMEYKIEESQMKRIRHHIFRFEEGIRENRCYTKEHWNVMRDEIKRYKDFCKKNDQFINSQCETAIKTILNTWETEPWKCCDN